MITGSSTEAGFVKIPLQVELDFGKGLHVRNLFHLNVYSKIRIISPGCLFVQKAFLLGLFLGNLFSEGLVIGILHFKVGLACQ